MYTIDKFSPSHLALPILLKPFYNVIKYLIKGDKVYWYQYINFFIFLFVIIGSMIHNEIFIINKWGLNEKTKLFLNKEFTSENIDIERIDTEEYPELNPDYYLDLNDDKKTNEIEIESISNS